MPSDVIEAHVSRLPPLAEDDWTPRVVDRTELERALLAGGVAGTATHPIDNVRGNIQKLLDHDPDKEFGLTGLQEGMTLDRVLGLVERAAGSPIDRDARSGPVEIRARPIVDDSVAAGQRLARASENGETSITPQSLFSATLAVPPSRVATVRVSPSSAAMLPRRRVGGVCAMAVAAKATSAAAQAISLMGFMQSSHWLAAESCMSARTRPITIA